MKTKLKSLSGSATTPCSRVLRPWTADDIKKMKDLATTVPASEIALALGRTRASVLNKAAALSVCLRTKGQNCPCYKYPNIIVEACRELYDQGHTTRTIATEYGLPLKTVRSWCFMERRLAC